MTQPAGTPARPATSAAGRPLVFLAGVALLALGQAVAIAGLLVPVLFVPGIVVIGLGLVGLAAAGVLTLIPAPGTGAPRGGRPARA